MFVKVGDKVRIIAGKDKGKEGTVLKTDAAAQRVLVEGANKIKKHQKPNNDNPQGGIIEKEAPIHMSNVMLVDPSSKKPVRYGKIKKTADKK